jgi:hypothetical protein
MKERVCEGIIDMLILAVPDILALRWEPEMDDRLIMDININFKSIREYMMGVVLVAPPRRTESEKELSEKFVQVEAHFASSMSVIVTKPSSLLDCESQK